MSFCVNPLLTGEEKNRKYRINRFFTSLRHDAGMKLQLLSHLTDRQIIRLHHELMAPVAVHEIMTGQDALDETALYMLETMIADFKPDTALLCLALCAAHIAEKHAAALPMAGALGFEAGRIAHDFGPAWLAHRDALLDASHEDGIIDLLDRMPEDFEALADLLDATAVHLPDTGDSARLCVLLGETARGFMAALDIAPPKPVLPVKLHGGGNVIAVPASLWGRAK